MSVEVGIGACSVKEVFDSELYGLATVRRLGNTVEVGEAKVSG